MPNVFALREPTQHLPKMFFDESGSVDIQRYDKVKYPIFKKLADNQESNFWRPTEISLSKDALDYRSFTEAEKHVFTSNLQRQIVLDSVQGRAPSICYLPIVSDPNVERFINAWNFFEGIHSNSYTHMIENMYPNASVIYDGIGSIRHIVECGDDISKYYDELLRCQRELKWADRRTKKAFYLSMVATNALEQIRFHISFACTFSFANRGKITGCGRIVTLIRQDEAIHCGFTQNVLRLLAKDDPDFISIIEECKAEVEKIYRDIYKQEREWIKYLFSMGPIVGLTEQELCLYLDYLVGRRMKEAGVTPDFVVPKKEPLAWMRKFMNEDGDDQPAPQEEEITSYQVGNIDMNINQDQIIIDW
jgi:ribonucleoside-diphosphate reductase beta chain